MKLPCYIILMFWNFNFLEAQYIPPQRVEISDADYEKWTNRIEYFNNKLNTANEKLDKVTKISFLINYSTAYFELKEPIDSVYDKLQEAILIDKRLACIHLNSYNEMGKMLPNFISLENRIGQSRWTNLIKGCEKELISEQVEIEKRLKDEYESNKNNYNFDLMEELTMIFERDQKVRAKWFEIERQYGKNSKEEVTYLEKLHFQDSVDLLRIEEVIEEFGYPGKSLVGSECQNYAMWIIHHAERNEIRDKYFPVLYEAATNGEVDLSSFKLYIDRVHIIKYGTQLYGTQSQYNSEIDTYEQVPIEDKANYKQRFKDLSAGKIDLGRINLNDYESN